MMDREISLIAHNLRSSHNVGSLLRTADGLGIKRVYLTGYTPYPHLPGDPRLPHLAAKIHKQIQKTALGSEQTLGISVSPDIEPVLQNLHRSGSLVAALEQSDRSVPLHTFRVPDKIAILVGREVEGIEPAILDMIKTHIEIPMLGHKESFNVAQAAAMALYHCRFVN